MVWRWHMGVLFTSGQLPLCKLGSIHSLQNWKAVHNLYPMWRKLLISATSFILMRVWCEKFGIYVSIYAGQLTSIFLSFLLLESKLHLHNCIRLHENLLMYIINMSFIAEIAHVCVLCVLCRVGNAARSWVSVFIDQKPPLLRDCLFAV